MSTSTQTPIKGVRFHVYGKIEGQHRIDLEDGQMLAMKEPELAKFRAANTELTTNEWFEHVRPPVQTNVAKLSGANSVMVNLAFEQLVSRLDAQDKVIQALTERVDELEIEIDELSSRFADANQKPLTDPAKKA